MKIVIKSIILIFVALVIAVVALVLLVDMNRFKPVIQHAASEKGIALQIGDLGWSLWPTLGVSLSEVTIASVTSPDKPIAQVHEASLAAALIPLLKGELKVDSLRVEGANINLLVDEQGKGNWEAFLEKETSGTQPPTQTSAADASKDSFNFEVTRISISDSALDYRDLKTGQNIYLSQVNLDVTKVNTSGDPFGVTVSWLLEVAQTDSNEKLTLNGKLSNQVTLDKSFNELRLDKGKLQLKLNTKSSVDIAVDYSLHINDLQNQMTYDGTLNIQPFNLRELLAALGTTLETTNNNALKEFAASAEFKGDANQLALEQLKLTLDKTRITGNLAVTDFATSSLRFALQGNSINLDDYLPPPTSSVVDKNAAPSENEPLPLDALRQLALDGKFSMDSLVISKMTFESIQVSVQANAGLIEPQFSAKLDQGSILLKGKLDARADSENAATEKDNLKYQARAEIKGLNPRKLLAALDTELQTANPDVLKHLSVETNLKGDLHSLALDNTQITLDKTTFTGNIAVKDFATQAISLSLKGNSINLDDYLPPVTESTGKTETAATEDTPLPLDTLRDLNLDAKVNLAGMTLKKISLQNVDLQINANKGVITQNLTTRAYQGDIKFTGKLDARPEKARLDFDGNLQGLELAPLLKDLELEEKKVSLSGAIQMQARGSTQGASVNQLIDGMNSTASFSGAQVRMAPLNIEEQFCKLVNLVTQNNTETVTWDSFTEMRQLNGNIVWRDQVINLESFNAGVSQLLLASTGKINLANDKYEFKLPIKLTEASQNASLKGCTLGTGNYWVGRGLSLLRCKGSFAAIDPLKDCGFDKSALGDLTKDYAEFKLREKHGAKIDAAEQKLKDKKQELLEDANKKLGGEGTVTKPKDILTNMLKKKLGAGESSAAASSAAAE